MALTKADIAESLYNELGLNKREARELVELYFDEIKSALADGHQVKHTNCCSLLNLMHVKAGCIADTIAYVTFSVARYLTENTSEYSARNLGRQWIAKNSL